MKKNSFFSGALFRENLRRFWPVSAVGLFIYFVSGPFLILTGIVRDSGGAVYPHNMVGMMLNNLNVGFLMMHLVLPVVAAVCVFSYLNRVNSVASIHAMPFSRRTLFVTNYISGLVLCVLPLIANWAILSLCGAGIEAFTAKALCMWLFGSFTIVLFVFSVAVLACMVSGNTVIATLTGFAFNFLVPALMLCMYGYAESFIYGFVAENIWPYIACTNPWLLSIYSGVTLLGSLKVWQCLAYIGVAIVISVIADILYHVRKLERCGDSYVFGWMQTFVGFLFAFVISTMTGLVLFEGIGIWAYIVGFVIGFVLGQMIALKTFHIFNKKSLRNLIIFAVLMALIIGGFALDVFGIEKKVPAVENVKSVTIDGKLIQYGSRYRAVTFESEPSIQKIIDFHKEVLEKGGFPDENDAGYSSGITHSSCLISYELKNGRRMNRQYTLTDEFLSGSKVYSELLNSEEVLGSISGLAFIEGEKEMYVEREFPYSPQTLSLEGADMQKLMDAVIADAKRGSMTTVWARQELYTVNLMVSREFKDWDAAENYFKSYFGYSGIDGYSNSSSEYTGRFRFSINGDCKNTMEFLENIGFGLTEAPDADQMIGVIFESSEAIGNDIWSSYSRPQSGEGMAVLSSEDMLRAAAEAGHAGKASASCRWMCVCSGSEGGYNTIYTMYVDLEKLPADIKAEVSKYVK